MNIFTVISASNLLESPMKYSDFLPGRPLARKAIAAATLLLAAQAQAAEVCTWNGNANGQLSQPANWACTGAVSVPGTGDSVVFPAGANTSALVNDFMPIVPVFYDVSFAPGYSLNGDDLNVSHLLTVANGFMNASAISGGNWLPSRSRACPMARRRGSRARSAACKASPLATARRP